MQNKEEDCLSAHTQAVLTILSAAMVLLAWASGSLFAVFFALLSMVVLKTHAVKCHNKKLDKFYLFAYSAAAVMTLILQFMIRR